MLCSKDFTISETLLYENNYNYSSYKFIYKFAFIPHLFFCRNQKLELSFQQIGSLVAKNIFVCFVMASDALS